MGVHITLIFCMLENFCNKKEKVDWHINQYIVELLVVFLWKPLCPHP